MHHPLLLFAACAQHQIPQPEPALPPQPPVAEQRAYLHREHGVERPDPYHWLRQREDPAVMAYIEAENAYTKAMTAPLAPLRKQLFDELLGRIQETDSTPPYGHGDWLYYTRTEQGRPYEIHCRRPRHEEGAEQVLLDQNLLAQGHDYFELGAWRTSPDHGLLAYTTDVAGDEIYSLRFRDLQTGEALPDQVEASYWSVVWANDNRTVFYLTLDDALRPWRVYRHVLGTPQSEDVLVYQEDDERFHMGLSRTRSGSYVLVTLSSTITTEIRLLPADEPTAPLEMLAERHHGTEYAADHRGDRFWIVTNDCDDETGAHSDGALNFKLVSAPVQARSRQAWQDVLPHREQVRVLRVQAFASHLVVWEREDGRVRLRLLDPENGESRYIALPEDSYCLWREDNPEHDASGFRFGYSSLVTPDSVFEADLASGELRLLKEKPVPGYDRSLYVSKRLLAPARDGEQVPVAVVHRKDLALDGTHPMLLVGYGAYGSSYDAEFHATALSLLERGFVFGIAQVRGGGDLGRPWYEAGKLKNKMNSFTDFIDSAEHLAQQGYTSPDRLAIAGTSAGGLLMGAVAHMRPDLFRVVVARVPFVDVVSTMLDESIPLTAIEWEEWGDPRDKSDFDAMLAYSPYDNVSAQAYPAMLVTSGLNDPRVQYWEPTKWVARLRALGTGDQPLLLRTHMGAGHAGASGRYGHLEDRALEYAFILSVLEEGGVLERGAGE